MDKEAGSRVASALLALPGVSRATPDTGQIEVHYDPSRQTIMDLIRTVQLQGYRAGML